MEPHFEPAIVIDTREQLPYEFAGIPTTVGTLRAGDYSLVGFEDRVAVERKSKEDAYGVVGAGRDRFERCLRRLSELERAAVVIECSIEAFSEPPPRTKISSQQAINSYLSWSCTYRIPVLWMPSRGWAERATLKFLAAYLKHVAGANAGRATGVTADQREAGARLLVPKEGAR